MLMFLEYVTSNFEDVWIITTRAGIEYRRYPVTNEELKDGALNNFFGCDALPKERVCADKTCTFYDVDTEYFHKDQVDVNVCSEECPEEYPWLGNPYGEA